MNHKNRHECPDCQTGINRRDFLQRASAVTAGAAFFGSALPGAFAAPSKSSTAETTAQKLYETLSPAQRSQICLPFNHASRTKISANWAVTKPAIHEDFFTVEQRGLIADVFKGVTSEEGHERFLQQMEFDDGGFDRYHVALFGTPQDNQFEWMLTGRHTTIRADGNCVAGMAFGGPVVYGHGDEDAKSNIFYYQTQQANAVFKALNKDQAAQALVNTAPGETRVELQGNSGKFGGVLVKDLATDQQELVASVIKTLLNPYREEDVREAMECLEQGGGVSALHMAFYKQGDLGNDGEWDIWRIEGPSFVCHFRGAPHVHAYLNIGTTKLS